MSQFSANFNNNFHISTAVEYMSPRKKLKDSPVFLPTPLGGSLGLQTDFSPPPSSSSPPSHFQLFVSVRYRKRWGGMGPWQCMPSGLLLKM